MRKLPPLTALHAFEATARHLSFKAAANELGLTPTAISHQVRLFEEIAGDRCSAVLVPLNPESEIGGCRSGLTGSQQPHLRYFHEF